MTHAEAKDIQGLTAAELSEAVGAGLITIGDALAEMQRRAEEAGSDSTKKIKEVFTSKANYLTVAFTGQGFPISATVRKWELIAEHITDIVAKAKAVRTAGAKVESLPFYRKAKEQKQEQTTDSKPAAQTDAGNTGASVAASLTAPGPLAGRKSK